MDMYIQVVWTKVMWLFAKIRTRAMYRHMRNDDLLWIQKVVEPKT